MPAHEHLLGTCEVIVSARLRGDRGDRLQGMTAVASSTGEASIAPRVDRVVLPFFPSQPYLHGTEAEACVGHGGGLSRIR